MNLYTETRSLTSQKEDHLTLFIAAALEHDAVFRARYAELTLADHASIHGWATPVIRAVGVQTEFDDGRCRPDMLIELEQGQRIICEHKIDAPETGTPQDEGSGGAQSQLERYVKLPVDGLLYFRSVPKPPSRTVLEHANYIRPHNRRLFLWADLYSALSASEHLVTRWLREAFQLDGLVPPHPTIGDLDVKDNRTNLARMLRLSRSKAADLGWTVSQGSQCQLYFKPVHDGAASEIWLNPSNRGLKIRFTPIDDVASLRKRMAARLRSLPSSANVETTYTKRVEGKQEVLDVTVPMEQVIGTAPTSDEIEDRLAEYVMSYLLLMD